MKKYYIQTTTYVYKFSDDFNEGQSVDCCKSWQANSVVEGERPMQAVKKYFKETLLYSFEEEHADIENERNGIISSLSYCNYIDGRNVEINDNSEKMSKFYKGEIQLFVAHTYLEFFELEPTKL